MKKRVKGFLLCACVCSLAAGAGVISYAASSTSASTESTSEDHRTPPEEDGSVMAKIVSISGNSLTISTADKPDGKGGPKPADGETPPEKPADGETPPEKPADGNDSNRPEMKFSDETTTVTLTDSTEITKGREHTTASASSLSTGDVVRIVLDGTSVTKLEMMGE